MDIIFMRMNENQHRFTALSVIVDVFDLTHTMKCILDENLTINAIATDVNSDNKTKLLDIVLMLKKLCAADVLLK